METLQTLSAPSESSASLSTGKVFDWSVQLRNVVLDRSNDIPLHVQLRNSLRRLIELAPKESNKLTPENEMVELLGIAPGTIRKALDGLVTEGLIERRRALGTIIKRHTGTSWLKTLAVIYPNFPSHFNTAHLTALNRQMGIIGGKMNIIPLSRGDDWRSCQERLDFAPSEGGVVFFNNFSATTTIDLLNSLQQQGYRSVLLGNPPANCTCNYVSGDAEASVRMGLEHLMAAGHRQITFLVGEPEEKADVQERIYYFKQITNELGLGSGQADVILCGTHMWENASEATTRAIETIWARPIAKHPTALFAISDATALGALFGLANHNIHVPNDVSILSWDGTELTRMVYPKLTSFFTPFDKHAATAIALLADKRSRNCHIHITPEFREGESIFNLANKVKF